MKTIYITKNAILCLSSCLFAAILSAQSVGTGRIEGGFGIDGDLAADTALHGGAASTVTKGKPSDDWFKCKKVKAPSNGVGLIDTARAAYIKNLLRTSASARQNYVFSQPMAVPKLTRSNGTILLDALYARDQADVDKTSITGPGGVKLIDDPSTWIIGSSSMGGKTDILEFFSHIRRKGNTVKDSLFFYFGVGIFGTSGAKNITAELFVRDVKLDTTINQLTNLGSQGGRVAWWLLPSGKVAAIGDMCVTLDYTASVFTLKPQVWVRRSTYDSFRNGSGRLPVNFRFGTFYGQGSTSTSFGYAEILPVGGASTVVAQGSANSLYNCMATPWGSATAGGYAWDSLYSVNQFIEMSINFTAIGVDPAYFDGIDPCTIPYRTLIFYSQSSVAPTSAPKDFAGPYPFWRYPRVISDIKGLDTLRCNNPTGSMYADSAYGLAWYKWTSANGNITGYNSDSTVITYNKPGKYYLETAPIRGCYTLKDSVIVLIDTIKPIAEAIVYDTIVSGPLYLIVLFGGNIPLSDSVLSSPYFGPSTGYAWDWTGPNGFISTRQDPIISEGGIYNLTLHSKRNGCFDTASTFVFQLPITLYDFQCHSERSSVAINWTAGSELGLKYFEVQKLKNGVFETLGRVNPHGSFSPINSYKYTDINPKTGWNEYRLVTKMESEPESLSASCVSYFNNGNIENPEVNLYSHPASGKLMFNIAGVGGYEEITYRITNAVGALVREGTIRDVSGSSGVSIETLSTGFYTLSVKLGETMINKKIMVK